MTPRAETPGQDAYQAYAQVVAWRTPRGDLLPPWHEMTAQLRTAWEAAAMEVRLRWGGIDT